MSTTAKKRRTVNYVNNNDFYKALVDYREALKTTPDAKIPTYIGICINSICNKLSTKYNFANYTYRDEMISDGVENCIRAVVLFDPERTQNPFAYFTQVAWNAFIRRIKIEKQENYTKHKNMYRLHLIGDLSEVSGLDFGNIHSDSVVENFESDTPKKKLTKPKKSGNVKNIGLSKFMDIE